MTALQESLYYIAGTRLMRFFSFVCRASRHHPILAHKL